MDRKEKKSFSLIARVGSFKHALRGLYLFVKNTHNAWVEIVASIVFVGFGVVFHISEGQWSVLVIAIFVLLMAEAFNTAMEVHMDLTSPEFHPFARDTKDIAAGAVCLAVIMIVVIVLLIFTPYVLSYLFV